MDDTRPLVILGFVGAYLLMCVGIGIWALRRTTSTRDFFMAGRDLGPIHEPRRWQNGSAHHEKRVHCRALGQDRLEHDQFDDVLV